MTRATAVLFVLTSVASQSAAQGPVFPAPKAPPSKSELRDTERPITVDGCIRGTRLKIDSSAASLTVRLLGATEFTLEGPKELLRQLQREHDGHEDEISGIAVIPASRENDGEIQTKEIGEKTRVTAGTRDATQNERSKFNPMRLKVTSMRHLSDKCGIP
jgi:hypothetical protein